MWMIIGAIIIVGGAFVFAEYRNVIPARVEYTAPAVSAYSVNATSTAIADNDWQKVLVGTNPAATKQKSLGGGTTSTQSQPLTETEKLGQSVISDYLKLKQSGGSASTSTINAIIAHALNNSSIVTTAKVYAFPDIKIGKDDSKYADLKYGIDLAAILSKNNIVGNEDVYARDGVEQKDPTILAKIDPIITAYQNILNGLLVTTVPPTLAKTHLDLINAMSQRLLVAKLLRNINTDQAAGLQGVAQYMPALQNLSKAFTELKQYFGTRGINFGTTTATSSIQGLNQR
jgi:hypothetical protein